MRDVVDDMDEERAGFGQAHLETQPGEVPLNGLADRGAHLVERLACHLHIADARNERAAFQIGRRAQLEVLRTPEIQLEDVARTADVAVGIERRLERYRQRLRSARRGSLAIQSTVAIGDTFAIALRRLGLERWQRCTRNGGWALLGSRRRGNGTRERDQDHRCNRTPPRGDPGCAGLDGTRGTHHALTIFSRPSRTARVALRVSTTTRASSTTRP